MLGSTERPLDPEPAYLTVQKYFVPAMWLEISRIPPAVVT
jgi:hypothetical protein